MKKINKILFLLLLFFLPTQLGKHFFLNFSYIFGVRVDYLAPAIYLTDVIVFLLAILNLKTVVVFFKNKKILAALSLLIINIVFSLLPIISFYWLIKIIEFLIVISLAKKMTTTLSSQNILSALLVSGVFELSLALMQFINKQSIQGIFYYFGERLMTLSTPDIAKASIDGVEFLRPYGTFSHPNSMAGFFLVLYVFVLTYKKFDRHLVFKYTFLLVSSCLVFISFSKIAIVSYVVLTGIYYFKSKKLKCRICVISRILILVFFISLALYAKSDPLTVSKRIELAKNSLIIIGQHLITGTGLGSYLIAQAKFPSRFYLFLNQPVHNIILLFFAETGLVVGGLITALISPLLRKFWVTNFYIITAIIFTGLFDHYWLTLEQNFILMGLVTGVILSRWKLSD